MNVGKKQHGCSNLLVWRVELVQEVFPVNGVVLQVQPQFVQHVSVLGVRHVDAELLQDPPELQGLDCPRPAQVKG